MKKILIVMAVVLTGLFSTQLRAQLPATAFDISPLLIGETVPDVMLTGTDGQEHSLVALTKAKPTIIIFYRGKWCSNCITHFSEEIAPIATQISDLGYNLIAISPDMPDTLVKTAQKVKLNPANFYSDGAGALSDSLGIAFQQQERMLARLASYSGGKNKGYLAVPGVFILNTEQKILFEYINPNGPSSALRMRGKLLLAVLEALK